MRGKLYFEDLKFALGQSLICPPQFEAEAVLACHLPKGTGPDAELNGNVLFVQGAPWKFRRPCDAARVAELIESYFRMFDPDYRVQNQNSGSELLAPVSLR